MYRVFLFVAFLAFCSAGPWGGLDLGSPRTFSIRSEPRFVQQPNSLLSLQGDENGIGDFARGGPFQETTQVFSTRNNILADSGYGGYGGYGQQPSTYGSVERVVPIQNSYGNVERVLPVQNTYGGVERIQPFITQVRTSLSSGYGGPQEELNFRSHIMPKTLLRQEQGPYATALNTVDDDINTIGQPQSQLQVGQPLIRNLGNSYGQSLEQPLVAVRSNNPYGQPAPQVFRELVSDGYGQPAPERIVRPLFKAIPTGYGHEQPVLERTVVTVHSNNAYRPSPPLPVVKELVSDGYGQPAPERIVRPLFKAIPTGYGHEQPVLERTVVTTVKTNNAYSQPAHPVFKELIRDGGYGQPAPERIVRPLLRTVQTGYGQEVPDLGGQPIDFPRQNGGFMPSSRFVSHSSPSLQMSDNFGADGW